MVHPIARETMGYKNLVMLGRQGLQTYTDKFASEYGLKFDLTAFDDSGKYPEPAAWFLEDIPD